MNIPFVEAIAVLVMVWLVVDISRKVGQLYWAVQELVCCVRALFSPKLKAEVRNPVVTRKPRKPRPSASVPPTAPREKAEVLAPQAGEVPKREGDLL